MRRCVLSFIKQTKNTYLLDISIEGQKSVSEIYSTFKNISNRLLTLYSLQLMEVTLELLDIDLFFIHLFEVICLHQGNPVTTH